MPQFLVKRGKISREGKVYKTGEKVDLPQEVADRAQKGMLEPVTVKGRGEPIPLEKPAPTKATTPEEKENSGKGQDEQRGRRRG